MLIHLAASPVKFLSCNQGLFSIKDMLSIWTPLFRDDASFSEISLKSISLKPTDSSSRLNGRWNHYSIASYGGRKYNSNIIFDGSCRLDCSSTWR